jgi:DNA-binding response OmpR family regulator
MHAEMISPQRRALIVEDEFLIAEELRERLSRLGFSVIATVDSADEGIAIATRERPDLVLMDIRLRGEKMAFRRRKRFASKLICRSFMLRHIPIS